MASSTLSSSPRPLVVARSLAATRIQQRLARPRRKHRGVIAAVIAAAAPLQLACPLDDDDDDDDCCDEDEFVSRSSSSSESSNLPLLGRRVLITAPRSYAASLGGRLLAAGARPLSVPGVRTLRLKRGSAEEKELDAALRELLLGISNSSSSSKPFAAVAFTSRAGIEAVLERIAAISGGAPESYSCREEALAAGGAALAAAAAATAAAATSSSSPSSSSSFSLWALGADAEALASAGVPAALIRTPREASTTGMVAAMAREEGAVGEGGGGESGNGSGDRRGSYANTRVLCPVPVVVGGLAEPPVVPRFLKGLRERVGAFPVRVAAYSTAPPADARRSEGGGGGGAGSPSPTPSATEGSPSSSSSSLSTPAVAPSAAAELSLLSAGEIDAVVFSSTAEAQGLAMAAGGVEALLGMMARGNEARREKRKRGLADGSGNSDKGLGDLDDDDDIVLAAHGPYTAAGASAVLGVPVPVVPEDFSSFAGVVGALEEEFRRRRRRRRR